MEQFKRSNLDHIKTIFEAKTGTSLTRRVHRPLRAIPVLAAALVLLITLAAFTYPLFSPLEGDALTLSAVYEGSGIVSIQVENRSHKDLAFQPQLKLVQWCSGEEITPNSDSVSFDGTVIPANSTGTMIVDLSEAYDMDMLEQSKASEWYYLLLTNDNFGFGQEWKCSVHFGSRQTDDPNTQPSAEKARYSIDPVILEQVEEELKFYFEDDYIGMFAANPLHYEYLPQVEELLLRSGKRMVRSVNPGLMVSPIPDGIVVDETFPLEKQYVLAGQTFSVHDAFGKLVGSAETEYMDFINVFLPAYKGSEDQAWAIPLMYFATYEISAIESEEDCAFIHGQIVSFADLKPYQVYSDELFVCYNVTHLFYTDLYGYVEDILTMKAACNDTNYYFDEQVYKRIENIYNYYQENLTITSWNEFTDIRPDYTIYDYPDSEQLVANGLSGIIESTFDIQRIEISILDIEENELFKETVIPEDLHYYALEESVNVSDFIFSLEEGVYIIDVSVWVDSEIMGYSSLWTQVFTTGNAVWP